MMSVTKAVLARKSCRQFLKDKPVPESMIKELLELASRAPSGGNLQPWQVHVVFGSARDQLIESLKDQKVSGPEYDIYPPDLKDPHRSRRSKLGNDMYDLIGVARTDRIGKLKHLERNFSFFDAPCGVFISAEKIMGIGQWCDIGMFIQNFLLLAFERGLATCAQEAWANHSEAVKSFLNISDEHILFCGIAVGYEDTTATINKLRSDRAPIEEFATFYIEKRINSKL